MFSHVIARGKKMNLNGYLVKMERRIEEGIKVEEEVF